MEKTSYEKLILTLFNAVINKMPAEKVTKETVVEVYNYIHDNIHTSFSPVQIINDIPTGND